MCCPEGIGNLNCQFQLLVQRKWLPMDAMFQGFAVEELHGNELTSVLLSDVVDGANIGVI